MLEGEEPLDSLTIPKLNVAVYPRSISEEMAAHLSLPLRELTLTVRKLVPLFALDS